MLPQMSMNPSQFQEILLKLSSAYDQVHAEKEALRKELDTAHHSHWATSTVTTFSPQPWGVKHEPIDPFEGRPVGEPVDVDAICGIAADGENACVLSDVKAISSKDRAEYEQYQRIHELSTYASDKGEHVTAAMVIEVALNYYPLMEFGAATSAIQRFMAHYNIDEKDGNEEVASDGESGDNGSSISETAISETASEHRVKQVAKGVCIPFDAFLLLAKLDVAKLHESQALQDDLKLLTQLHRALVNEKSDFWNEQRESITNIVETVSAVVICINAFTLGPSIEHADSYVWFGVEIAFQIFYIFELILKMVVRGYGWFFLGTQWRWNLYDLVVVIIGITDLTADVFSRIGPSNLRESDMEAIRAFALLGRLARLMRLLRFKIFSELKGMVNGVFTGLQVLFWAIVLLGILIYSLGIFMWSTIGRKSLQEHEHFYNFRTLTWAMFTLFRCFTDGCSAVNGTPLHVHLAEEFGLFFMVVYIFMFLFVTVGIFNLIMGMFIDNVFTASRRKSQLARGANAVEMESRLQELLYEMSLRSPGEIRRKSIIGEACEGVRRWFENLLHSTGHLQSQARLRSSRISTRINNSLNKQDDGMKVSRQLFNIWLSDEHLLDLLSSLEINTSNKAELFDVLDVDQSGELDIREMVSGLMRMRGPPQKSDSVAALLGVRHLVGVIEEMRVKLDSVLRHGNGDQPDPGNDQLDPKVVGDPRFNPKITRRRR